MKRKPEKIKTLILAAHPMELRFVKDLGRKYMLIEKNIGYLAAGIGPVAATFGLTHFLEDYHPEKIIALGTAGVINPKYKIGDLVSVASVGTKSFSKEFYTPKLQKSKLPLTPNPSPLGRGELVRVYAPQEITKSSELRKTLEKKYDVEHLESFAYAFVAKKFRIPIEIHLGLTNIIHENAHKEWLKNQEQITKKLSVKIKKMI